jgi:hypothetical protein
MSGFTRRKVFLGFKEVLVVGTTHGHVELLHMRETLNNTFAQLNLAVCHLPLKAAELTGSSASGQESAPDPETLTIPACGLSI